MAKTDPVGRRNARLARCGLALADVDPKFSDAEIDLLIKGCDAPPSASDLERANSRRLSALLSNQPRFKSFANGVRQAVIHCITSFAEIPNKELVDEIKLLHTAANSNKFAAAAERLQDLSDRARDWLQTRHRERNGPKTEFPIPRDLRDKSIIPGTSITRQRAACELLASLCVVGATWRDGLLHWHYYAPNIPETDERAPRRGPELELVAMLRQAWLVATEETPARTANLRETIRGPFARFVDGCLSLVLTDVSYKPSTAVELINKLDQKTQDALSHFAPADNIDPRPGCSLILCRNGATIELFTREKVDCAARYPTIIAAAASLPVRSFRMEGDAVVLGPEGRRAVIKSPDHSGTADAIFCVSDIQELDGQVFYTMNGDGDSEPLEQRQQRLTKLLAGTTGIVFDAHQQEGTVIVKF